MTLLLLSNPVTAWQWSETPQPLLKKDVAIRADAGSPLAWDDSLRVLWFVRGGAIASAWWNGSTFETSSARRPGLDPMRGLFVDSGLHFVYCLNSGGQPVCLRKQGSRWITEVIGEEPVRLLLGIDERLHRVFAYDETARGIRVYSFNPQSRFWKSKLVAAGLGVAGDAGVVDPLRGVIYTVHESADASIPRVEGVEPLPSAEGAEVLKSWPMVATQWKNGRWSSRVICDTGVPQQPAVHSADGSVFFARRRGNPSDVHRFMPARGKASESLKVISGWSGRNTFRDHDSYKLRVPRYPSPWLNRGNSGGYYGVVITIGGDWESNVPGITLTAPISVVPYYEPIWTDTPVQPRLAHFRAVMNPRQQQLVQHRQVHTGEIIREQTGERFVGYVYRDANGVIARRVYKPGSGFYGGTVSFESLGPDFDPANPPSHFSQLAETGRLFRADKTELVGEALSSEGTIDPESPWVPAYLRQPTSVTLRTFGHDYALRKEAQRGGRYRNYSDQQTSLAMPSSIAVDQRTGVTFYTQAPSPTGLGAKLKNLTVIGGTSTVPAVENASLSAFHAKSETKLPRPPYEQVWIVMVY